MAKALYIVIDTGLLHSNNVRKLDLKLLADECSISIQYLEGIQNLASLNLSAMDDEAGEPTP